MTDGFLTPTRFRFCLAGIALLAAVVYIYATSSGLATSPDSRIYIEAARRVATVANLSITHDSATVPLTHFPPLLPFVLAGPALVSIDALQGLRWLNCAMLFLNVLLTGVLIHELSLQSKRMALIGAAFTAGLLASFENYVWAWSEPLFIAFVLLTFLSLAREQGQKQLRHVLMAGLFAGLAWLTRYAGVAFVVAIPMWLLLQPFGFRERSRRAAAFLLTGIVPFGLWSLRNIALTGHATDRTFAFHRVTRELLILALRTGFARLFIAVGLAAVALIVFKFDLGAWRRTARRQLIECIWLSIAIYLLTLLISISFFDSTTPLDNRILAPALALLIIAGFSVAAHIPTSGRPAWPVRLGAVLCAIYLLAGIVGTVALTYRFHRNEDGLTSKAWMNSSAIAYVRNLPLDRHIYSNGEEAIYLLTGRSTRALPRVTDSDLSQQTAALNRDILEDGATVIVFSALEKDRNFLPRDQITKALPSLSALQLDDGVVFSHTPARH